VQIELFSGLHRIGLRNAAIRYCRLNRFSHRLECVDYAEVERAFHDPPLAHAPWRIVPRMRLLALPRRWLREVVQLAVRLCRNASGYRDRSAFLGGHSARMRRGDVLVCTGMSWLNRRYGELIAAAKRDYGISVVALIHDMIPITHPQYSQDAAGFRRWADAMLRNADRLVTDSRYSRETLIARAREIGLVPGEVTLVHLGATFTAATSAPTAHPPRMALPRPYVLFVSTVEIRKNHLLLVRVWKRLIERHGHTAVPALIFVGSRGWLIDPLLTELAATRNLDGKVQIMSGVSDAELELCYRYCLFTAYPSFVEGWGLPVAESLQHGKLCIASNRSSLPEVGDELVDYIDPEDEEGTLAAVERAIFDHVYRAGREAQIRRDYVAPTWVDCARTLVQVALEASQRSSAAGSVINAEVAVEDRERERAPLGAGR